MTGYITTTSFGVYFFKYVYRDEAMYSPFGAVLGVAQLIGFADLPAAPAPVQPRGRCTPSPPR